MQKTIPFCTYYVNVNQITVPLNIRERYLAFSRWLNQTLLTKYPKYYAGGTLYESRENPGIFTVITLYYDVPDIYEEGVRIVDYIKCLYDQTFQEKLNRVSIELFLTSNRIPI